MESCIDFFELAAKKENMERDLEEKKKKKEKNKKKEAVDDQHHQELTAMAPPSKSTTVDNLHCFTEGNRRRRTNRNMLGTMKVTKEGPLYDMKDCEGIVDGVPLSHEDVLRRENLLKRPMEVEPKSTSDDEDDDNRVLMYFDFFEDCAEGQPRNGIVIRERANNPVMYFDFFEDCAEGQPRNGIVIRGRGSRANNKQEEKIPKDLLKRKIKNNGRLDQEIKKIKVRRVLDHDARKQPRAKIVETQLSLDLNQPPPEETQEKKQEKKLKNKKRKPDIDDGTMKKKTRRSSSTSDNGQNPPPELPQEVMDRIRQRAEAAGRDNVDNGELILVMQKKLTPSDLDQQQNRLIYTTNQLRNKFLTEEEASLIEGRDEKNHHIVINVPIIEPSKEVESVNFTRWIRGKNSESFLLNQDWGKVVSQNRLQLGQAVQLWAFRINRKLHFAFVILPPEESQKSKSSAAAGSEQERDVDIASTSKAASSIIPDDDSLEGVSDEQKVSTSKTATSATNPDDENEDGSGCGDQCMLQTAAAAAFSSPPENDVERRASSTVSYGTHSNDEDKESTSESLQLQLAPRMNDE